MMLGLPIAVTIAAAVITSAALAVYRGGRVPRIREEVGEWVPLYCVSVLAASVSPFPVLGAWSGDWLLMYEMGQAVMSGDLPANMLARPPLFGASAAPLWLLQSGLIPYQLMAAVASAAAMTAVLHFIHFLRPGASRLLLLPLLISPFFLHHTAAAWPKLLAGALILSASVEALKSVRMAGALFFALAVSVHEGSVVWAPFLVLCCARGPKRWREFGKTVGAMAAAALLIVAPFVVWVLREHGLQAKIASSPVLEENINGLPFFAKTALATITAFVGWGPVEVLIRWWNHPDPIAPAVVGKEFYWLITSWITTLAGTLAGLLYPFWFVRSEIARVPRPSTAPGFGAWATAGVGIAALTSSMLVAFHSTQGTMQNALVPLALGAYGLLVSRVALAEGNGLGPVRKVTWVMALFGTLPWLLINMGTAIGLRLSAGFRERFGTGSEGDYFRIIRNGLQPLGMSAFPAVPLLCSALFVVSVLAWRLGGARAGLPPNRNG
jgi:hypothetical protein